MQVFVLLCWSILTILPQGRSTVCSRVAHNVLGYCNVGQLRVTFIYLFIFYFKTHVYFSFFVLLFLMWFSVKSGNKKGKGFGWNERYKVALGVAEALVYLHSKSEKPVIHRDVKSSNILLSDDFEPQVLFSYIYYIGSLFIYIFIYC